MGQEGHRVRELPGCGAAPPAPTPGPLQLVREIPRVHRSRAALGVTSDLKNWLDFEMKLEDILKQVNTFPVLYYR